MGVEEKINLFKGGIALFIIFCLCYMVYSCNQIINSAEKEYAAKVTEAELRIEDGWTVSVNGEVVEDAVDVNEYVIEIDEKNRNYYINYKKSS